VYIKKIKIVVHLFLTVMYIHRNKRPREDEAEEQVCLVRAPLMAILSTPDFVPLLFRPFKCPLPGYVATRAPVKFLGARRRVGTIVFQRPPPPPAEPILVAPPLAGPEKEKEFDPLILFKSENHEVVCDPLVARVLREHQRVGVSFLYECISGMKKDLYNGRGCILADDMGLGKTLQSIAVLWVVLNTNITPGAEVMCRRALIITPASLVGNWASELDKWLKGQCDYTCVDKPATARMDFGAFRYNRKKRVLIASYETFRNHVEVLDVNEIDLVICDEAHRLKNDRTKTARCINELPAPMRMLLSGTPIQNDLDEFFALITLANPAVVGTQQTFHKHFANPISRGRQPEATVEERECGQERLDELSKLTDHFILRRTNRLNARFLPPKIIMCVFLRMSSQQEKLYSTFLKEQCAEVIQEDVIAGAGAMGKQVLVNVNALMKIASHPSLLLETGRLKPKVGTLVRSMKNDGGPVRPQFSCKINFVYHLLKRLRSDPEKERVVIISNWTQTLGIVEKMCTENKWPVHRLDGSVALRKRHQLVSSFNDLRNPNAFVFLLSSKAGGCGINLIGASRLVMLDPDWNPANDKQAMARIWREGQKRLCYIYRLFATGTIDEKQLQRQICKDGLAQCVVDPSADLKVSLSAEQIRDLFTYRPETSCDTHDSLECTRCDTGSCEPLVPFNEDDLNHWGHGEKEDAPDPHVQSSECTKVFYGRVEFTAAEIKRLEEEEEQVRQSRKVVVVPAPVEDKENVTSMPEEKKNEEPDSKKSRRRDSISISDSEDMKETPSAEKQLLEAPTLKIDSPDDTP